MKKDTIYIDNDDEITSITDKVQTAPSPIVALVLPKRCTVLQSSVNMKILNRAATTAGKKVVLITSEAALLPVAGTAGLFVAKTLQSKPAVPPSSQYDDNTVNIVTDEEDEVDAIDATKSIGELAGATAVAVSAVSSGDDDMPIELGDEAEEAKSKKDKKTKKNGEKKNKKLVVPNFDSFRAKLFAGIGGLILIIGLWYVATSVLPRAKIIITTENKAIAVNMNITASAAAQSIDSDNKIVPAQTKTIDKTENKKFAATGEKNVGTRATGTMTIINCTDNTVTVPAGARFTNNSLSFAVDSEVIVPGSNFKSNGDCKEDGKAAAVPVAAVSAGDQYNVSSGRTYASNITSGIFAIGSSMSGGTNKVVKVVSQNDCENAKNELLNTKTDGMKAELESQLKAAGFTPIGDSFTVIPGKATCGPDVDVEATESTATVTFKASMTGVNTAGLEQLVQTEVSKDLPSGQSIFDAGVKTASLVVKDRKANGDIVFVMQTDAQTGIKQDPDAVAKSIAGKKRGETSGILRAQPSVTDVKIDYRPFWVTRTPKNTKHISITFENNGNK